MNDFQCVFSTTQRENGLVLQYLNVSSVNNIKLHVGNLANSESSASFALSSGFNHIAITRNGSTYKLYMNGVLKSTVTSNRNISVDQITFGDCGWLNGENGSGAYIRVDEVRISNKVEWSSKFTPPTKPYQIN